MNHTDIHIAHNIAQIRQQMENACIQAGRPVNSVRLMLATKTLSAETIIEAFKAGESLIGENKVQELRDKFEPLKAWPHETHLIGHLQSNKINQAIRFSSCIQSLDRLELAEKLNSRLAAEERSIDVYIQVNTSGELSKFGCHPDDALKLATEVKTLPHLNIKGLMTIGLFSDDTVAVRQCFKILRQIQERFLDKGIEALELSMGMSGDLTAAIEEGSTMIRVGTAIFGHR